MTTTDGLNVSDRTKNSSGQVFDAADTRPVSHPFARNAPRTERTLTLELASSSPPNVSARMRRLEFRTERLPEPASVGFVEQQNRGTRNCDNRRSYCVVQKGRYYGQKLERHHT